jgi:hypothetical protein
MAVSQEGFQRIPLSAAARALYRWLRSLFEISNLRIKRTLPALAVNLPDV